MAERLGGQMIDDKKDLLEGLQELREGQQKAREDYEIMNEAWWNGLSEEARLAEETRVLEQLEYEITIPDCRNAARRS